jgi:2-keto-3-deoxy-L-rhamnonate aldolase RhmA
MSYVFNSLEILKKNNINTENMFPTNFIIDNYKYIVLNYLLTGRNCGHCSFVDLGDRIKDEYISNSNSQNSLIFQIEGEAGVNNIDDIIQELPSNSRLFIGPYDLSQSVGIAGKIWDTRVVEKMCQIIKKCKDKNVKIGTFTDSYEGLKYWTELEIDFIEYASDLNVFMNGFKSAQAVVLETIKSKYMKFGDNYQ